MILSVIGGFEEHELLNTGLKVMMASLAVLCLLMWYYLRRAVSGLVKNDRTSILRLDNESVELEKEDAREVRIAWSDVALIRSFEKTVAIFPKAKNGIIICVDLEYKDQIEKYVRDNNISAQIV